MYEIEIERSFPLSQKALFEYWTKPELMMKWFAPGNMATPSASSDLKVGGQYQITMQGDETHIVEGEYQEVERYSRLSFTWSWSTSPHTTVVELKFEELSQNQTKLHLRHREFSEEEFRDRHADGWTGCLSNLQKCIDI